MTSPLRSMSCLLAMLSISLSAAGPSLAQAPAPDGAAAARRISKDWGAAVIAVRVVSKMRMAIQGRQMDESERVQQIRATVIHPSGLAVSSLSEIDPSRAMEFGMAADPDYDFETEVTDVKILQTEGDEIPAQVVLRDKDLDLAFIRPTEPPAEPMPALNLAEAASPDLLDQVVVLGRLGEVGNRVPSVALDRIQAILTKPRTFYVTGLYSWMVGLGCPVFSLDGDPVGVLLVRSIPAVSSDAGGPYGDSMPVILPCEDILEAARQVPDQ